MKRLYILLLCTLAVSIAVRPQSADKLYKETKSSLPHRQYNVEEQIFSA